MTWRKTMQWILGLALGDPKELKELKGLAQCRGSTDYDMCKWQSAVFKGDSKKCWTIFSRDSLACSFKVFPHLDRWVPLFDLMSSRRITHARYNSPSVSYITEMLCRLSRKGLDLENMTEAAHKHPTNIMTYFKTQGRHTYAWVIKTYKILPP